MSTRPTILVVDDDPPSRRVLRTILKLAYSVIAANDAATAIAALDRVPERLTAPPDDYQRERPVFEENVSTQVSVITLPGTTTVAERLRLKTGSFQMATTTRVPITGPAAPTWAGS